MNVLERTMRDRFLPEFAKAHDVVVLRGDYPSEGRITADPPMRAVNPKTGEVMVEQTLYVAWGSLHRYDADVSIQIRRALATGEFPYVWEILAGMLRRFAEWSVFLAQSDAKTVARSSYSTEDLRAMAWFLGVDVPEEVPRLATSILLWKQVKALTA